MSSTKILRIALLFVLPVILIPLTGAGTVAPDAPQWADQTADFPCDKVGETIKGRLGGGEEISQEYTLEPGKYTIAAWADWELVSLRLTVLNADGEEMARDEGRFNTPVCQIDIETAGTVDVTLTAGMSRLPGVKADYELVIAKGEGCYERDWSRAKTLLDEWTLIAISEGSTIVHWEVLRMTGADALKLDYELTPGSYTLVAETINRGDDIDMYIKRDGEVIRQDERPDNYPSGSFEVTSRGTVVIEIYPWEYQDGKSTEVVVVLARDSEEG